MKDNQVSATALRVLQGLVYSATRPSTAHLVSPEAKAIATRILQESPGGAQRLKNLSGPVRRFLPLLEHLMLPGISLHYALRKRWLEEQARQAIVLGVEQIINLGAGMDSLLLRLSQDYPELTCIEIDHPASQQAKRAALQEEPMGNNLEFLSVDFSKESLAERLPQAKRFDANKKSLVICEGVLVYLLEDDVRLMLRSIHELMGPGTQFLFTFLATESPTDRQTYGPLLHTYLRLASEELKFQIPARADALQDFLSQENFDFETLAIGPELVKRYGVQGYKGPIHDLEVMASARAR